MKQSSPAPKPFADFVMTRLLRQLPDAQGGLQRSIAETEHPFCGDDWYWADDNAKMLELLSAREIWRAYPSEVVDIIRFLLTMLDGPLMFRRLARPRFVPQTIDKDKSSYIHSLMNIETNLSKGVVSLGMRFHDGRDARHVTFTGNYVRFKFRNKVYTSDVENCICDFGSEQIDDGVRLWWSSKIEFRERAFPRRTRYLGMITYTCTIQARSMFVDLQAALDIDPEIEVSDVVLTFGSDNLSHNENNIRYEALAVVAPGRPAQVLEAKPNANLHIKAQSSPYWSVFQRSQMAGFAAGIHSLPFEGSRLSAIRVTADKEARLHWVVSEHEFPGHQRGRVIAGEKKLITSGGFYADVECYAAILRRQSQLANLRPCPVDFSISYDYGAEIHALARCFRIMSEDHAPFVDEALKAEIHDTVTRLFDVYNTYFLVPALQDDSTIFSRSIAFVALGYAEMAQATSDAAHHVSLRQVCEIISRFERQNLAVDGSPQSGFVMGTAGNSMPYVDCHAACLLALVRASIVLDESAWLGSIDRGLAAFRLDTILVDFEGPKKQDVVGIDYLDPNGQRHTMEAFWNFKSGMCLRLFNLLKSTDHVGLREIWAKHSERLRVHELLMRDRIGKSLRDHDVGMEILTSVLSSETNSETQPWVALALCGES